MLYEGSFLESFESFYQVCPGRTNLFLEDKAWGAEEASLIAQALNYAAHHCTLKKELTRHNFFANKFDSSAWNDFGANPRPKDFNSRIGAAPYVIEQGGIEHRGSWHAWHDLRKTKDRLYCQQKLDAADAKSQVAYWQNRGGFRRVSMITENRGQL